MKALVAPRLVMFDLDGTLVDTAPDLAYAVNGALDRLGLPQRDEAIIRKWVGNGAEALLRVALTGGIDGEPDHALMQEGLRLFEEVYRTNLTRASRFFPGVEDCLAALYQQRIPMACITNKRAIFTEPLLRQMGIDGMFERVLSGDSLPQRKPDPAPLLHVAQALRVDPAESWMVGDSDNDVRAARAAGVPVICVDYGYTSVHVDTLGADRVVSNLQVLPSLF